MNLQWQYIFLFAQVTLHLSVGKVVLKKKNQFDETIKVSWKRKTKSEYVIKLKGPEEYYGSKRRVMLNSQLQRLIPGHFHRRLRS